jgi:Uma2 family endonuclease
MPRATPLRTVEDLFARPEGGPIEELVSGEAVERETPTARHEQLVQRLHDALSAHVESGDLGAVFRAPWPVELSRYDLVRPDLSFVAWGRDGVIGMDRVRGAPELVVEVLSPESRERDLGEKMRLYQWSRIFEYWVVDPEAPAFLGFTKTPRGYESIAVEGSRFRSVLLQEFELNLERLFAGMG